MTNIATALQDSHVAPKSWSEIFSKGLSLKHNLETLKEILVGMFKGNKSAESELQIDTISEATEHVYFILEEFLSYLNGVKEGLFTKEDITRFEKDVYRVDYLVPFLTVGQAEKEFSWKKGNRSVKVNLYEALRFTLKNDLISFYGNVGKVKGRQAH